MSRNTFVLVVVAAAVVVAACGGGATTAQPPVSPSESPRSWQPPATYDYHLTSTCGEQALIGAFDATVVDGTVTEVVGSDDNARAAIESGHVDPFPTVSDLLARADQARADGADVVEVATDAVDGSPTLIEIDWSGAIDDESCFAIDVTPATGE